MLIFLFLSLQPSDPPAPQSASTSKKSFETNASPNISQAAEPAPIDLSSPSPFEPNPVPESLQSKPPQSTSSPPPPPTASSASSSSMEDQDLDEFMKRLNFVQGVPTPRSLARKAAAQKKAAAAKTEEEAKKAAAEKPAPLKIGQASVKPAAAAAAAVKDGEKAPQTIEATLTEAVLYVNCFYCWKVVFGLSLLMRRITEVRRSSSWSPSCRR